MVATTQCVLWAGPLNNHGYGLDRGLFAHRLAWERERGPIPEGMHVHHVCRNAACVNPDHLELMVAADHRRHHAPGTPKHLRDLRQQAGLSLRDLERKSGVNRAAISRAERGLATLQRHELQLVERALGLEGGSLRPGILLLFDEARS